MDDKNVKQRIMFYFEKSKRSEDFTMYYKREGLQKYVMSKYNPSAEATSILQKYDANINTLWVVLGYGLGYIPNILIEEYDAKNNILIVEPNQNQLQQQIQLNKNNAELTKHSIMFTGDNFEELEQILKQVISKNRINNINVIGYEVYKEVYREYFSKVLKLISIRRALIIMNNNTIKRKTAHTIKNIITNYDHIADSYDIKQHKDKYRDIPAVVVSAGPSLDKNIAELIDFKGIVLVVGRALDQVLRHKIQPDFVGIVEPEIGIYKTFRGNTNTDIPLLAVTTAYPQVVQDVRGPIYFLDDGANDIFNTSIEEVPIGGSVATLCTSVANLMGCNPIIFVGQDLAYTGNKYHAEGCLREGDSNEIKNTDMNYISIEGYYGEQVLSRYDLVSFKKWFEEFIQLNPDKQFINATEGGALIKGTINKPLKEVVEQFAHKEKVVIEHTKKLDLSRDSSEYISGLVKELRDLAKNASRGMKQGKDLKQEFLFYKGLRTAKINTILIELDKIDQTLEQVRKNKFINRLFEKYYNEFETDQSMQPQIGESKIDRGIRIAELNYNLYESLKNSAEEMINILEVK